MSLTKNLSSLIESSKIINSGLDLSKILKTVTAVSKDILDAEAGSLMLIDEKTNELVFTVALGKKAKKLEKDIRLKIGQGIAGQVAKTGKPVLVKNACKDPRFSNRFDKITGFRTHSMMCVPLKTNRKIIGVLEALNSKRKNGFSSKDLDLFQAFASQVAVAIDNARMHKDELERQRVEQELDIAHKIQDSLLPKATEISGIRINAINTPAKHIGGDLYDFFDLGDDRVGVMISDVSGKGIPAAIYMVQVMNQFRFAAKSSDNPAEILKIVNSALIERAIMGMFVTLFYVLIDKRSMKLQYISAGHPPAMYYSKDENKILSLDKAQNPPLGIMNEINYKSAEMDYTKDSAILLYTDGVIEARLPKGEQYTSKRLEKAFYSGLKKDLFKEISFGVRPLDDYTLVEVEL